MDVAEEVPVLSGKSDADMDLALAALADDTRSHDVLSFSNQELKILELYDELKEIELEKAVARAQLAKANGKLYLRHHGILSNGKRSFTERRYRLGRIANQASSKRPPRCQSYIHAQRKRSRECHRGRPYLEGGPRWSERNGDRKVPTPVLRHVCTLTVSTRALHPAIDERDLLAMSQANLSATFQTIMNDTTMLQAENIKAMQHNRELAATVWDLAGELRTQDPESIDDIELRERLETLRREGKDSRRRFRMLKSLASGMVVGSGVDWAEDAKLRDIVLDSED
jgi:hypothetical protein